MSTQDTGTDGSPAAGGEPAGGLQSAGGTQFTGGKSAGSKQVSAGMQATGGTQSAGGESAGGMQSTSGMQMTGGRESARHRKAGEGRQSARLSGGWPLVRDCTGIALAEALFFWLIAHFRHPGPMFTYATPWALFPVLCAVPGLIFGGRLRLMAATRGMVIGGVLLVLGIGVLALLDTMSD
jgi:hypothetical protein